MLNVDHYLSCEDYSYLDTVIIGRMDAELWTYGLMHTDDAVALSGWYFSVHDGGRMMTDEETEKLRAEMVSDLAALRTREVEAGFIAV